MKEAVHLIRLAALLAAGIALFLIARHLIVPADFGKFGHFRPGALDDVRSRPVSYAGHTTCDGCHDEKRAALTRGKHAKVGCEACHGPQARHADDPDKSKPVLPDTRLLCPTCHEANSAKPKTFPQVVAKEHSGGEACNSCHHPHSPKYGQEVGQ